MFNCPACGAEMAASSLRCACGADATLLVQLGGLADAWFNRGLADLAEGRVGRALEWLSACCAFRPTDIAALVALARTWARLGHKSEAADALERAAALEPDAPDVALLREALAGDDLMNVQGEGR